MESVEFRSTGPHSIAGSAVWVGLVALLPMLVGARLSRFATEVAGAGMLAWFGTWLAASFALWLVLVAFVAMNARQRRFVVTAKGISLGPRALIAADDFAGLEIRRWDGQGALRPAVSVVVRLRSGGFRTVPMLSRPTDLRPDGRTLLSRSGDGAWAPVCGADGAPLVWSRLTDDAVLAALSAGVADVLRPSAGLSPVQLPPSRGLEIGSPRGSVPVQRLLPSMPPLPAPDADGLFLPTDSDAPQKVPAGFPVVYRSRATARFRLRSRAWVRFEADRLVLVDGRHEQTYAYEDIRTFDKVPWLDGRSRLSLVLADGTPVALTGMRHGLWAANPRVVGNQLQWWRGDRPAGAPDGTLRWGSDLDGSIVGQLRAQLDAARPSEDRARLAA